MGKDLDDQIEEYITASEPIESDPTNFPRKNYHIDSDKFWTAVFIGLIVNVIFGIIFPLTFSLFGGIISGYYLSGGIGKSIKAGFFCGLFSGIITVMFFFISAGLAFAFVMLLIKQFTGISPLLIVTVICLALGTIYSLVGMIGGAIGGVIASLTK